MTDSIASLIDKMPGTRGLILGVLELCQQAQAPGAIDDYIEEQLQYYPSVYTPVEFRAMLENVGALAFIPDEEEAGEDGAPAAGKGVDGAAASEAEDTTAGAAVDDDGFLVPGAERRGLWLTSAGGNAYLEGIDSRTGLEELLDAEPDFADIYLTILRLCAEEPRSLQDIDSLVDATLRTLKPRRYAGFFFERLEKLDAVRWEKNWKTTELGMGILAKRNM